MMWKMFRKENGLVVEFGSRRKLLAGGRDGMKAAAGGGGVGVGVVGAAGGGGGGGSGGGRRSASLRSELRLSRQKTAERASKSGTVCNTEVQIATRPRR